MPIENIYNSFHTCCLLTEQITLLTYKPGLEALSVRISVLPGRTSLPQPLASRMEANGESDTSKLFQKKCPSISLNCKGPRQERDCHMGPRWSSAMGAALKCGQSPTVAAIRSCTLNPQQKPWALPSPASTRDATASGEAIWAKLVCGMGESKQPNPRRSAGRRLCRHQPSQATVGWLRDPPL